MVLECPHCSARLNAANIPDPDKPVRCSKCKQVFTPSQNQLPGNESPAPSNDEGSDWMNVASTPVEKPAKSFRKTQPASAKKFPLIPVLGGVVGVLAIIVVIVFVLFMGGDKSKSNTAAPNAPNPGPSPSPSKKETSPPKKDGPKADSLATKAQIPPEFAELFATAVADRPAPTSAMPALKASKDEIRVPAFPSENAADPNAGKLSLEELKKATAFIKVVAKDTRGEASGGSGSGFVVHSDASGILVATNFHVVGLKSENKKVDPANEITVVLDSGLPTEKSYPGKVIAFDAEVDLAVVKVRRIDPLPKAIDPSLAPKLMETMNIRSFGFPLGQQLGVGGLNPSVTVGSGTVSSIRLDPSGVVSKVQINGASLNPGNSGGPVVDDNGKLVGIVVSGIPGSGIANAIPAAKLAEILTGHILPPVIRSVAGEEGQATFQVDAPVTDPLNKLKDVFLHVWSGDALPKLDREPNGNWKVIPSATKIVLKHEEGRVNGLFTLPTPSPESKLNVVLQLECVNTAGAVAISSPARYQLALENVATASDAITFIAFLHNLTKYYGQVVAVRGKLSQGGIRRGLVTEFQVSDEKSTPSTGVTFVADRELATQLSELTEDDFKQEVRLTVRMGKAPTSGNAPARIVRVDFIGKGDRLVKNLPSGEDPKDPFVALNRKPDKFAGKTIEIPGYFKSTVFGSDSFPELSLFFMSAKQSGQNPPSPENLVFTAPNSLIPKVKDYPSGTLFPAVFTVRVEPRVLEATGAQIVTVTKIETVDKDGKTRITLE